jgi:hypothetical protein
MSSRDEENMTKTDIDSLQKKLIIAFAWIMILFISLGSATYAWFTGNQRVSTSHATGRAAEDDLSLLLGTSEGDLAADTEVEIQRVNSSSDDILLPVTTPDLETWGRSVALNEDTTGGYGSFEEIDIDENGNYGYHGQIWMEVHTDRPDSFDGMKAAIYLEKTSDMEDIGHEEGGSGSSGILAAARLGLKFDSDSSEPVIIRFDEATETSDRRNNTYIGSQLASEGKVLRVSGNTATEEEDPAENLSDILITEDTTDYPEEPLATIDLNTPVQVDIYFYLEGCDPDCVEAISATDVAFQLGFYAALTEE